MKALVYHGPHHMRWEDWSEAPPNPDEVVVAVRAVGICGSDVHGYTGESGRRTPPLVMGHEATGEVVALGDGIQRGWLGQRVVVQPLRYCGACDQCEAGKENLCRNRRFYGASVSGAMAEHVTVPIVNLLHLPDSLSFTHGTLTEPFAVAIHAVRQAGDLDGKSVLIAGGGPVGLLTLVAARRAGARSVIVTDLIAKRRETAKQLGADVALDPATEGWRDRLHDLHDSVGAGEVDVAFDAVGIAPTFNQALEAVCPGGLVVALGGWQTVPLNLAPLVAREVNIRGTFNFTLDDFESACRLLASAAFDPALIVTSIYPLADGAEAFTVLTERQADHIKVVLTSAGAKT